MAGHSGEDFSTAADRVVWWGRISPEYMPERRRMSVRWIDPAGDVVLEEPVEPEGRRFVTATLALNDERRSQVGTWRVEVLLTGDPVDRRSFRLVP